MKTHDREDLQTPDEFYEMLDRVDQEEPTWATYAFMAWLVVTFLAGLAVEIWGVWKLLT